MLMGPGNLAGAQGAILGDVVFLAKFGTVLQLHQHALVEPFRRSLLPINADAITNFLGLLEGKWGFHDYYYKWPCANLQISYIIKSGS